MSGITVPADRTLKQPTLGFCRNPQCREVSNKEFRFTVKDDYFCCPKCKADQEPMIGVLTMTHLLIPSPTGPVIGLGGVRYQLACDQDRAYLATATNNEAATDNAKIANCPGCIVMANKQKIVKPTGESLSLDSPKP